MGDIPDLVRDDAQPQRNGPGRIRELRHHLHAAGSDISRRPVGQGRFDLRVGGWREQLRQVDAGDDAILGLCRRVVARQGDSQGGDAGQRQPHVPPSLGSPRLVRAPKSRLARFTAEQGPPPSGSGEHQQFYAGRQDKSPQQYDSGIIMQ